MVASYRFERDVLVEGVSHRQGKVVSDKDLPAGCVESMLYSGWITEFQPQQQQQQPKQSNTKA